MASDSDKPILFIPQSDRDLKARVIEGFGEPKEIVEVTPAFRRKLVTSVHDASSYVTNKVNKYPGLPVVVAMQLHIDAMAKSHRPLTLLDRCDMLPIGTRRFGELLLPATISGLNKLAEIARKGNSKKIRANLSTVFRIEPWGIDDVLQMGRLSKNDASQKKEEFKEHINKGNPIVLETFITGNSSTDKIITKKLLDQLEDIECDYDANSFGGDHKNFLTVQFESYKELVSIADYPGVRHLSLIDSFSPIEVRTQMFNTIGPAPDGILTNPVGQPPIVGVVDSGIRDDENMLSPWIAARETFVIPPDTDHLHGTFVAGLVASAKTLNGSDARFPDCHSRVLDVAAVSLIGTNENELLYRIEEAIKSHPEVKVWNCSFGSPKPGSTQIFSRFAQRIDELSKKYGILFVIAAGNYNSPPLRAWPPDRDLLGADRISMPSEAIRALTVGSVAHELALVKPDDPSPFSRRGPGAASTPKPDVTHRGGNCDAVGNFGGVGVKSILPGANLGESIGTSFSTPLVSTLAANVWNSLDKNLAEVRPETVKALVVHSAALSGKVRSADDRNYHGFGIPESVIDTLFCSPDTFTMMFEAELFDGVIWEKTPFPVPRCLHVGRHHLRAEVVMTLVYSPPLDAQHGAEYVRANIDASFGRYEREADGKTHHHGLVPLEAPKKEDRYEKAMVEYGFKWSPVKVYHGLFKKGVKASNFRLKLELLRRAGEPTSKEFQKATLLISFRGIDPGQPVYQDGIRALNRFNWANDSLVTRTHLRI